MLSPELLRRRNNLLQELRSFFLGRQYVEVDTPVRQPVLLPESQIIPIAADGWFLQSSPEQCMKRLLAQGIDRIFQICPCFRKDEQGRLHSEEFTMLEWYHTGWTYLELMEECEKLIAYLSVKDRAFCGKTEEPLLKRQGHAIDLNPPWPKLSVHDAFLTYGGTTVEGALKEDTFDQILVERIEPRLGLKKPVFLVDYPVALASLARKKEENPDVAERFELYVGGIEIANGFSELVDAKEQKKRFLRELSALKKKGIGSGELPEQFLYDLQSLGECAGIALGLDRLLLLLWEKSVLDEVQTFSKSDLRISSEKVGNL